MLTVGYRRTAREIGQTLRSPADNAFHVPRLSSYCGAISGTAVVADYVSRLFRRDKARFGGGIVHDHLLPQGPVGKLRAHLMHEAFSDLEEVLQKVNSYSSWGAQTLDESGKRAGLLTAIAHGLWTFLKTYVLHAGFLDGREGLMLAVSNAGAPTTSTPSCG
jgi:hypothetical protein